MDNYGKSEFDFLNAHFKIRNVRKDLTEADDGTH